MNKKFEFFDHTADTKIKAYGATLEEAFENAAIATTTVMTEVDKIKEKEIKKIKINAKNEESLLYDFLEEILFLLDTEGFLVKKINNLTITKKHTYELSCELIGDFASEGYEVHTTIKAITYSDMQIIKTNNKYTIQIVHDI